MRTIRSSVFAIVGLLALLIGPAAKATLPDTQYLQISVNSTPGDLQTWVEYDILVTLDPKSRDGYDVTWQATEVYIVQYDGNKDVVADWGDPEAEFDAGDWEVTHADPLDPQTDEFTELPLLVNDTYNDENGACLYYAFQLDDYGSNTALIDLVLVDSDERIDEDIVKELVSVSSGDDDPLCGTYEYDSCFCEVFWWIYIDLCDYL